MTEYRFKSHTSGCGATPANWKGWAATGAFVIAMMAASYLLLAWEPAGGIGPGGSRIAVWSLAIPMLSVGFIVVAGAKTRWTMDVALGKVALQTANKQGSGRQPGPRGS